MSIVQVSKVLERLHKCAASDWNIYRAHDIKVLLASYSRSQDALAKMMELYKLASHMKEALEEIATDEKVEKGHGDYDEGPMAGASAQKIARTAIFDWIDNSSGESLQKAEIAMTDEIQL